MCNVVGGVIQRIPRPDPMLLALADKLQLSAVRPSQSVLGTGRAITFDRRHL